MTDVTIHSGAPRSPLAGRGRRRRTLAGALLLLLLAGCATSFGAETNKVYQPGPGISVRDTGVYAINMLIVTDGAGNGTLVGALINQQQRRDALETVTVSALDGRMLDTTILPGTIALPPGRSVQLADTGWVRVGGPLDPGANCSLTMTFRNAAPVTAVIPMLNQSADFAKVPVGPTPTATPPSPTAP